MIFLQKMKIIKYDCCQNKDNLTTDQIGKKKFNKKTHKIVLAKTNAKLKVKMIIPNSKRGDRFIINSFIKNLVLVLKCKIFD